MYLMEWWIDNEGYLQTGRQLFGNNKLKATYLSAAGLLLIARFVKACQMGA